MKVIGITGGVGAGKSAILNFLESHYKAKTLVADQIAHDLMEPAGKCYLQIRELFPDTDVFLEDGSPDREKLAAIIFDDKIKRRKLNRIVHPAVRSYIEKQILKEMQKGELDLLIIEAALLVEEKYGEICDELWYVYASEQTRARRLMDERGYSFRKIQQIFDSQLSEEEFRKACRVVINNDAGLPDTFVQIREAVHLLAGIDAAGYERERMQEEKPDGIEYVFGLDIGTRNVVGTVGYKEEDNFIVVAQYSKQHDTRSMLDGQIHDIAKVGRTIGEVKQNLEEQIGTGLSEVCIAAAGRVLKTVTTHIEHEYDEETVVSGEDIHNLELLGIEKAQDILKDNNDTKFKFYCVGYSVIKYYLNEDVFSSLESHKAMKIAEDMVVTFLPEDVVDGLYTAVAIAGLQVANMTLEPIAAMNVAIPEAFRMLNIALVDVGAGTSDISITKDGSIAAYGMIPLAGDEITELIVQTYLVDFKTAEKIKLDSGVQDEVSYKDIMSISHTIPSSEVWELIRPVVDHIAEDISKKIYELNGDKTVSAVFIVGGGGKVHEFAKTLAGLLDLPEERVALRGEEVLQEVVFKQGEIRKDPLLVTPIGICYNYYEQKNNFIVVRFNGERIKLFDNSKLTIVDAAMQAGFPNEHLFPRRGKELNFHVNGKARIVRGEPGESAVIRVDGRNVTMNTPLEPNDTIEIFPSTAGVDAVCTIERLPEYGDAQLTFYVNGKTVECQRFVEVNGEVEPACYEIQDGDIIEIRNYYTVEQLAQYMDVEIDMTKDILVNNRLEDTDALLYDNFSVDWTAALQRLPELPEPSSSKTEIPGTSAPKSGLPGASASGTKLSGSSLAETELPGASESGTKQPGTSPTRSGFLRNSGTFGNETEKSSVVKYTDPENETEYLEQLLEKQENEPPTPEELRPSLPPVIEEPEVAIMVTANGEKIALTGKSSYIFVDIFDYIDFDLKASRGRAIVTLLNGKPAQYGEFLKDQDKIEIYWKEL